MNEKSIVLTKDIAEIFNRNRPEREKYKTTSVGWIIRELGFNKVHTRDGKGWLINKDRLKYWQQIYQIEETSIEKGQKGQKGHQPQPAFSSERSRICEEPFCRRHPRGMDQIRC